MIVDDEEQKRMLLVRFLRRTFPQVKIYECSGGEQAIQELEKNAVDVVITDNRMAGVSGLELTRCIRERQPELPIVMVTGHPNFDQAAAEAGVTKLIDFARYAEIGQVITDVLETRKHS